MQIIFLGTSGMVPTKERNVTGIYLNYKDEGILFDCGEGTQRQMNIAGIKRTRVKKILVSHWHGDHVSGIIGLIQTIGNSEDPPVLQIFGPIGTKEKMSHMLNSVIFDSKVEVKINEVEPKGKVKVFYENDDYHLEAADMSHSVPCIGFSFVEKDKLRIKKSFLEKHGIDEGAHLKKLKAGEDIEYKGKKISAKDATTLVRGKKVTYISDTMPCKGIVELADDADIMISEACYLSDLEEKAEQYHHMTARGAGMMANQANVKRLILTHFSQRYKEVDELKEDAKTVFDDVVCAEDFMKIQL